jgi:hypothetical protein
MSLIQGRAHIGPDGELRIPLPQSLRGQDVSYTLDVQPLAPKRTNGHPSAGDSGEAADARAKWRAHIRRFAGTMPDLPDIERPGPDSYEPRDAVD